MGLRDPAVAHLNLTVFTPLNTTILNAKMLYQRPRHSGGELFLDCLDK